MTLLIQLLLTFILVSILIQDFKSRRVYWFFFPAIAIASFIMGVNSLPFREYVQNTLINILIITTQLIVLIALIYISKREFKNIKYYIGLGDILFLYSSCFFVFTPLNFTQFQLASLVFSLALHIIFCKNKVYTNKGSTIALAGWQSVFLAVIILWSVLFGVDFQSDKLLINIFQW